MKLKPLGANKTELETAENTRVLFSYETPVAARIIMSDGAHFYRTNQRYSNTTTRHIKSWLPFNDAEMVDPAWFEALL